VVKEIGSGVNDARPKLLKLLTDPSVSVIVVEHKDRLTRSGYNYLEQLLKMQNRRIEVIDLVPVWIKWGDSGASVRNMYWSWIS